MPHQSYVFAQFLHLLPRYEFQRIVNKYQGDYRTKHFKCWDQLACMMFAHIRQEDSLRDIDIALNAHAAKLYHIGIQQCPRSTLADANERRDYRIYEEFAKSLMQRARRHYAQTELAVEVDNGDVYILARELVDLCMRKFGIENYTIIAEIDAKDIENKRCRHPLYDRESIIILGKHVTLEAGTGLRRALADIPGTLRVRFLY